MATDGSGTEAQRPVNKRVVRLSEELSPDGERRLARALSIVLRAAARRIPSAKGSMGGGDEGPDARPVPEQGSEQRLTVSWIRAYHRAVSRERFHS